MLTGFLIVAIAGFMQGTFVLPMTLTRNWRWEHTWFTFSVIGMFLFNWIIGLAVIPHLIFGLQSAPLSTVTILAVFGLGWGVGALLFGVGMERLGMALGYSVIMGLVACLGALVPLSIFSPHQLVTAKGGLLLAGTALVVAGIALCSLGDLHKQAHSNNQGGARRQGFAIALFIAIMAGILSCLPNVGVAFGQPVVHAVITTGASSRTAPSAIFVLFFTAGGIVNCVYCLWLMLRRRTFAGYLNSDTARNTLYAALMAFFWIGSFHLYGVGSRLIGAWGVVVGWPLFICISIGTGIFWGLAKGEWKNAPPPARRIRNAGILFLFLAIAAISLSGRM
ncbi:MAG: hypothetical protein FWD64_00190 [Acidobacteriaceae bacterium]|nr:hypothetical protein [Acidobacteriaceae bacterium]